MANNISNERLVTLLYNALTFLKDVNSTGFEELEEELGITEFEYKQIVEDYQDTICCTFGKDELREEFFNANKPGLDNLISNAQVKADEKKNWIEEKREELSAKPRSEWTEEDWEAHNYCENVTAEADYFDSLDDR